MACRDEAWVSIWFSRTRDLRAAVRSTCTSFYMPLDRLAVVSYEGSADELARRLDLDRTGGPGTLVGAGDGKACPDGCGKPCGRAPVFHAHVIGPGPVWHHKAGSTMIAR